MSHNHKYFLFIKKRKEVEKKHRNKKVEREKTELTAKEINKFCLSDVEVVFVFELEDDDHDGKKKKMFK